MADEGYAAVVLSFGDSELTKVVLDRASVLVFIRLVHRLHVSAFWVGLPCMWVGGCRR